RAAGRSGLRIDRSLLGPAMSIPNELLTQALDLQELDRAELARRLLLSLEPEGEEQDPGWEEAWRDEIEGRIRRVEAGETTPIPAEEVLEEIRRSLERGRRP